MNAKYELIADDILEIAEGEAIHTLYRIRALRDCWPYVRSGGLGGYLASTANLDTQGNAWVMDNACIYGSASVSGHACVRGEAHIGGEMTLAGEQIVSGDSRQGLPGERKTEAEKAQAVIAQAVVLKH